jgi:hypothetical protein
MTLRQTPLLLLSAVGGLLTACEKVPEAPYDRGICYQAAPQPDGKTLRFNVAARNIDSIEKCAAQLEGIRQRFLALGGQNHNMIGAYQGSFLFLRPDGIYRAESWNSAQYLLLVRTGDGRLAMPGAMPMDPADAR